MKIKGNKKFSSLLLCTMLIVATAFTAGCSKNEDDGGNSLPSATQETVEIKDNVLGEGQTMFLFKVTDGDGKITDFEIHTDKSTVGEALLDVSLIDGDDGEYGLYVKTVNGITADYDVDQSYWAFYINGEYAATGVDSTAIEEGATYSFKVEK